MTTRRLALALILLVVATGLSAQEPDMRVYITLFKAAEAGETAKVRELVDQGMEVNALVSVGSDAAYVHYQSLLGAAVTSGNTETVAFLLERGADVNLNPPEGGAMFHPLYFAVRQNSLPMVRLLLEGGSSPISRQAALFFIAQSEVWLGMGEQHVDRSAALQELIRFEADVNATDKDGCTPLTYAQWRGNDDYAKILRRAGASEPPPEMLMGTFVYDPTTQAKTGTGADSFDSNYTGKLYVDKGGAYPTAQFVYRIHSKSRDKEGRTEYLVRVIYAPNNVWCCRLRFSQNGKIREIDAVGQNLNKFPTEINQKSILYGVATRKE